ncbi:hypothetical protein LJR153_001781 [Paenibacillus sp. LjRoot153]|uniref:hypothetical protein n=1 Tax=Paenibacillus sp. LjRoot153 TaxID=3342270 RepID=UPI003ED05BCB
MIGSYEYYKQIFTDVPKPFAFVDLDLLDVNIKAITQEAGGRRDGWRAPVMLSLAEAKSDPQSVGAVTGLLLLFGNLGGIVLSSVVQLLLGNRIVAICVLAAVAILILPAVRWLQTASSK